MLNWFIRWIQCTNKMCSFMSFYLKVECGFGKVCVISAPVVSLLSYNWPLLLHLSQMFGFVFFNCGHSFFIIISWFGVM